MVMVVVVGVRKGRTKFRHVYTPTLWKEGWGIKMSKPIERKEASKQARKQAGKAAKQVGKQPSKQGHNNAREKKAKPGFDMFYTPTCLQTGWGITHVETCLGLLMLACLFPRFPACLPACLLASFLSMGFDIFIPHHSFQRVGV